MDDTLIFILFTGFIAAFYSGAWSIYAGVKRILHREGAGIILVLLAIGLFVISCTCFKNWYFKVAWPPIKIY